MNALDRFLRACDVRDGRTLIVGSKIHEGTGKPDRRTLYGTALGVDMEAGPGVDRVLDLEEQFPDGFGDFAHIECTSVLEHSRRPWLMATNLERALVDGGTIVVLVPWVWRIHAYPSDYWRMTPAAIESIFPSITWEAQRYIVENELVAKPPNATLDGVRYMARSELVMFGRKCSTF
jgi:hypothetical protein